MAETGDTVLVTAADQLLAIAELDTSAVVSVHLHDAEATMPRTRLEITGTTGDLALVSAPEVDPWAAQLQVGQLDLYHARAGHASWQPVPVDRDQFDDLPIEARNVARLYHQLAIDLRSEVSRAPDFRVAHRLHQLIELAQSSVGSC